MLVGRAQDLPEVSLSGTCKGHCLPARESTFSGSSILLGLISLLPR